MKVDIIEEIARRLDIDSNEVAPVLETVVERIRQQVAHYGYARLADLGTFRGQDGSIAFEPDPAFAETINARFSGLGEIRLRADDPFEPSAMPDEPPTVHPEGMSPDEAAAAPPSDDVAEAVPPDEAGPPLDQGDDDVIEEPLEPGPSAQPSWVGTEAPDESLPAGAEGTAAPEERSQPPWEGTEAPDESSQSNLDGTEAPEESSQPDLEGTAVPEQEAGGAEFFEGTAAPPTDVDEPSLHSRTFGDADLDDGTDLGIEEEPGYEDIHEPEVDKAETSGVGPPDDEDEAHAAVGAPEEPDDTFDDEDDVESEEHGAYWDAMEGSAREHPLGPESEPPYEDADYSFVGEREEEDAAQQENDADRYEERDGDDEPTISWAPLGSEASRDADSGGDDPQSGNDVQHGEIAGGEIAGDDMPGGARLDHDVSGTELRDEDLPDEALPDDAIPSEHHSEENAEPVERAGTDVSAEERATQRPHGAQPIRPAGSRTRVRRDAKPIWIGVGVIVLVAAAAVAYFITFGTPDDPAQEEVAQQEVVQNEPVAPPDTAAAEAAADTAAAEEAPPPAPVSTPLRSEDPIDPAQGGFTIVVYSETSESAAEEVAAQYRSEGYRASVLSAQQDGVTRYRVGVGQFETLEDASQQRNDMAGGDLPADAWVLRI